MINDKLEKLYQLHKQEKLTIEKFIEIMSSVEITEEIEKLIATYFLENNIVFAGKSLKNEQREIRISFDSIYPASTFKTPQKFISKLSLFFNKKATKAINEEEYFIALVPLMAIINYLKIQNGLKKGDVRILALNNLLTVQQIYDYLLVQNMSILNIAHDKILKLIDELLIPNIINDDPQIDVRNTKLYWILNMLMEINIISREELEERKTF